MKPNFFCAVFAAIVPSLVEADVSTFSQTGCVTKQSTKSTNKILTSTKSYTLTFSPKVTVVITPTKTIIPSSTTVTAITTSTSTVTEILSQVTDTATETITETETESTTTTLISTEFATSSVIETSTSTSTVSTSAGFTPLASQLAAQGYTAGTMRKRSAAKRITRAPDHDESSLEVRAAPAKIALKGGPKQYPVAVSCYRFVQVISTSTVKSTAKTTQIITAIPGTITVTSTQVEPTTTTSMPTDALTTITTSATTTITETATETSTTTTTLTTTSTAFAPIATYYPACNSDNRVTSINGNGITDGYPRYSISRTYAASAYDCCVLCQQTTTCGSSYFWSEANPCVLIDNSGTCSPTEQDIEITTNDVPSVFTVSNGGCGQAFYNGRVE